MMIIILLLEFLIGITIMSLVVVYGFKYAGDIVGARVNEMHRQAEYILNYKRVPVNWIRQYHGDRATQPGKYARWRKQETSRYLRRLKQLARYFSSTPAFEDMASRQRVLCDLEQIAEYWRQADWEEITSPPEPAFERAYNND